MFMKQTSLENLTIDYVEMYVPVAKPLVYWHTKALGFTALAYAGAETGKPGFASYLLSSGQVRIVLTSAYPLHNDNGNREVSSFVNQYSCGIKRVAFAVDDVKQTFSESIANGGMPVKFPTVEEDDFGFVEEAAIKLYDQCEVVFIDRSHYKGIFKPGYRRHLSDANGQDQFFTAIDHIASELHINETDYWTDYLSRALGSRLLQKIDRGEDNQTGMILNISQLPDMTMTWVMTEPESHQRTSRVQQSLEKFGAGIHHLAFSTDDILSTIKTLRSRDVELVSFPSTYYDMLRKNDDFKNTDIDALQAEGILIDKEGDSFLLQKFVKPMSDRPYFFYEIVQRVNGYNGFAVNNIVALRKAEEVQITQVAE